MYISCIGRSARVDPCGFSRDHPRTQAARSSAAREDCAKVVEFLATGLSDYVTGAVIPIDVAATVGVRLLSRAVLWPRRTWPGGLILPVLVVPGFFLIVFR